MIKMYVFVIITYTGECNAIRMNYDTIEECVNAIIIKWKEYSIHWEANENNLTDLMCKKIYTTDYRFGVTYRELTKEKYDDFIRNDLTPELLIEAIENSKNQIGEGDVYSLIRI